MHPYVQEAIIVTALFVGLIYAYKVIPQGLQDVKDAARSPIPEPEGGSAPKQIDPDAEDKIELSTLHALSEGHSFELRNAAIRIVSARAITDPTRKLLLKHLASKHHDDRNNAINALWLLFYGSETPNDSTTTNARSRFQDKDFFNAIVTALIHTLPYHKTTSDSTTPYPPSPIRPLTRPPHEASLFILLTTALRGGSIREYLANALPANLELALDAGLVTKWLANYPFPCTLPQYAKLNYHKSDVSTLFGSSRYAHDDPAMADIMRMISGSSKGTNQLLAVGLRASRIKENITSDTGVGRRTVRVRRGSPAGSAASWASSTVQRGGNEDRELFSDDAEQILRRLSTRADPDHDVRMTNGEDTAGEVLVRRILGVDVGVPPPTSLIEMDSRLGWTPLRPPSFPTDRWDDEVHPRVLDRSQEEVQLRRRNRETVVVAERGQPFGRENILRRDFSDLALGPRDADGRLVRVSERRRPGISEEGMQGAEESEGSFVTDGEESGEEGSMPDLADVVTGSDTMDGAERRGDRPDS